MYEQAERSEEKNLTKLDNSGKTALTTKYGFGHKQPKYAQHGSFQKLAVEKKTQTNGFKHYKPNNTHLKFPALSSTAQRNISYSGYSKNNTDAKKSFAVALKTADNREKEIVTNGNNDTQNNRHHLRTALNIRGTEMILWAENEDSTYRLDNIDSLKEMIGAYDQSHPAVNIEKHTENRDIETDQQNSLDLETIEIIPANQANEIRNIQNSLKRLKADLDAWFGLHNRTELFKSAEQVRKNDYLNDTKIDMGYEAIATLLAAFDNGNKGISFSPYLVPEIFNWIDTAFEEANGTWDKNDIPKSVLFRATSLGIDFTGLSLRSIFSLTMMYARSNGTEFRNHLLVGVLYLCYAAVSISYFAMRNARKEVAEDNFNFDETEENDVYSDYNCYINDVLSKVSHGYSQEDLSEIKQKIRSYYQKGALTFGDKKPCDLATDMFKEFIILVVRDAIAFIPHMFLIYDGVHGVAHDNAMKNCIQPWFYLFAATHQVLKFKNQLNRWNNNFSGWTIDEWTNNILNVAITTSDWFTLINLTQAGLQSTADQSDKLEYHEISSISYLSGEMNQNQVSYLENFTLASMFSYGFRTKSAKITARTLLTAVSNVYYYLSNLCKKKKKNPESENKNTKGKSTIVPLNPSKPKKPKKLNPKRGTSVLNTVAELNGGTVSYGYANGFNCLIYAIAIGANLDLSSDEIHQIRQQLMVRHSFIVDRDNYLPATPTLIQTIVDTMSGILKKNLNLSVIINSTDPTIQPVGNAVTGGKVVGVIHDGDHYWAFHPNN